MKQNILRPSTIKYLIPLAIACQTISCKKFIDVGSPVTSTNAANVYTSDETAISVLNGIYAKMSLGNSTLIYSSSAVSSISVLPGLLADELTLFNTNNANLLPLYRNDLTSNTNDNNYWSALYNQVFSCNSAIEGIKASSKLTPAVAKQLLGEALFMRAFSHFYLVMLYGDVPLVTQSDPSINAKLTRVEQIQVYAQIINDLKEAKTLLSEDYLAAGLLNSYPTSNAERVRPTKWAAAALLARVYLYTNNYSNAASEATEVINNTSLFQLTALDVTFKKNSTETIWSLQPVNFGSRSNTGEGALFILPSTGPSANYPVYLSNNLLESFEPQDQRLEKWVDSVGTGINVYYYPKKYQVGLEEAEVQEYSIIFRLGEQFLIRAEAYAHQNKIEEAQNDLNQIRNRAGLPNTTANNEQSLTGAIFHERQVELFTEWGHRWFDLKRSQKINEIMNIVSPQKGGIWASYKYLFPIPQTELNVNINLVQNEGY